VSFWSAKGHYWMMTSRIHHFIARWLIQTVWSSYWRQRGVIESEEAEGRTPLFYAIIKGHYESVRVLIFPSKVLALTKQKLGHYLKLGRSVDSHLPAFLILNSRLMVIVFLFVPRVN